MHSISPQRQTASAHESNTWRQPGVAREERKWPPMVAAGRGVGHARSGGCEEEGAPTQGGPEEGAPAPP
jgi:hypothetical protein